MSATEEYFGPLLDMAKRERSGAREFEASMPSIEKIVIAGAGQAGGRAAEALRSAGFRGSITMIGEEKHPPYERPQLSKELLAALDAPVAYLKPASDWTGVLDVTMITGAAVVACDAERQTVATGEGEIFGYDRLLLATGTQPKRIKTLEGASAQVHYLRNIEDAMHLRQSFHRQVSVVERSRRGTAPQPWCPVRIWRYGRGRDNERRSLDQWSRTEGGHRPCWNWS